MNYLKLLCILVFSFIPSFTWAINWEKFPTFSVGAEVGFKSLSVLEKESDNDIVAKMSKGLSIAPSLVISSNEKYIWPEDNWAYHVQVKGGWFNLEDQIINDETYDMGTTVSGVSIYAVPVGYYHFNRTVVDNWSYKLGLGIGFGWLNLNGDFQVTNSNHELYNDNLLLDASGFGTAIGIYFEANYKNHAIVLQNYAPQISDEDFYYQQHNLVLAYRYKIEKKWIQEIFEK